MILIQMQQDKTLQKARESAKCYRGEQNADRLVFSVPRRYDGLDLLTCTAKLYHRVENRGDYFMLCADAAFDDRILYTAPVTAAMTAYAGKLVLWLEFLSPDGSVLLRTGECALPVTDREGAEELVTKQELSLLNEWQVKLDAFFRQLSAGAFRGETGEKGDQGEKGDNGDPGGGNVDLSGYLQNTATGNAAIGAGSGSLASAKDATAYGADAHALAYRAIALGRWAYVSETAKNAVQIGNGANETENTAQIGGSGQIIHTLSLYQDAAHAADGVAGYHPLATRAELEKLLGNFLGALTASVGEETL